MNNKQIQMIGSETQQLLAEMRQLAGHLEETVTELEKGECELFDLGAIVQTLDNVRTRIIGLRMAERISRRSM